MTPYVLLLIGLLLIFFEFFLPGGIIGMAGGLLVILSMVYFIAQAESGWAVFAYILGTLVAVALLFRFALWRIRRQGKKGGGIYLNSDQEGYVASSFEKEFIGKSGTALTDLKPSGHILVEGKRFQALSKTGYISQGAKVRIVGGAGAHLFVKQLEEKETSS